MKTIQRIFIMCCCLFLIHPVTTFAASEIEISTEASTVASLMYDVKDQYGVDITENVEFILKDINDESKVYYSSIQNSILSFKNIPFGSYVIVPDSNKYYGKMYVDVDKDYLNNQHMVKDYIVYYDENQAIDQIDKGNGTTEFIKNNENSKDTLPETGDKTNLNLYVGLIIASLGILILLIKRKGGTE